MINYLKYLKWMNYIGCMLRYNVDLFIMYIYIILKIVCCYLFFIIGFNRKEILIDFFVILVSM